MINYKIFNILFGITKKRKALACDKNQKKINLSQKNPKYIDRIRKICIFVAQKKETEWKQKKYWVKD